MAIKSKEGCERRINAILRSYMRDFAGGGAFGYDWPTFRLNSPERYAEVRALQNLYIALPFRDGTRLPR
jgi:hypothetical protein